MTTPELICEKCHTIEGYDKKFAGFYCEPTIGYCDKHAGGERMVIRLDLLELEYKFLNDPKYFKRIPLCERKEITTQILEENVNNDSKKRLLYAYLHQNKSRIPRRDKPEPVCNVNNVKLKNRLNRQIYRRTSSSSYREPCEKSQIVYNNIYNIPNAEYNGMNRTYEYRNYIRNVKNFPVRVNSIWIKHCNNNALISLCYIWREINENYALVPTEIIGIIYGIMLNCPVKRI
jgi:hypothetical protein